MRMPHRRHRPQLPRRSLREEPAGCGFHAGEIDQDVGILRGDHPGRRRVRRRRQRKCRDVLRQRKARRAHGCDRECKCGRRKAGQHVEVDRARGVPGHQHDDASAFPCGSAGPHDRRARRQRRRALRGVARRKFPGGPGIEAPRGDGDPAQGVEIRGHHSTPTERCHERRAQSLRLVARPRSPLLRARARGVQVAPMFARAATARHGAAMRIGRRPAARARAPAPAVPPASRCR